LLFFVPGPTLPSLEGLAAAFDFMFAPVVTPAFVFAPVVTPAFVLLPVVIDEWVDECLYFVPCANAGLTSPAATSAMIVSLVVFMNGSPLVERNMKNFRQRREFLARGAEKRTHCDEMIGT
jgi:hypothetical protein